MQRLIAATGHRVQVDLALDTALGLSGELGRLVRRHRDEIVSTVAVHGARNVRIFGSVERGDERPESDVSR